MIIKKIGILYHPLVQATCLKAQELTGFLNSRDVAVWSGSAWETEKAITHLEGTDLILTTGGDGTILRAAQAALPFQIPITGINMGKLGFLTEIKSNEAVDQLSRLLAGDGWLDERTMLEAELRQAKTPDIHGRYYALNEVVLVRGKIVNLIQVQASINGKPLTNYRSDGVIVATATGSTGYALSAGGPILHPQAAELLLVPIVSHLSVDYRLVLPSSSVVQLQLMTHNPATVSIDGHQNIEIDSGSVITVKQSTQKTQFLRLDPPDTFYSVLEEKLRGKR